MQVINTFSVTQSVNEVLVGAERWDFGTTSLTSEVHREGRGI